MIHKVVSKQNLSGGIWQQVEVIHPEIDWLLEQIEEWAQDHGEGFYVVVYHDGMPFIPSAFPNTTRRRAILAFSDADTAFEFKMRWV